MLKPFDVMLVGVGGQGTILATKILARAARKKGYDIKVSEIKGMAQRGGSVVTQLRLAQEVHSPLVAEGGADVVLAFEKLEALRWLSYLKPEGTIIINNQAINPVPVLTGAAAYPEGVLEYIGGRVHNTKVVKALDIALNCGNPRTANVVLLGVLAKHMPIEREIWEQALEEVVPDRFLEVNKSAFAAGYGI
ncbi:indolepyruvate ferredoxin oxidoreductase beta subunit [Desulfohalotomaculum tongense]|uniref:indolepyruvate oxidoreductase subunit beta n=1 Tax=Desulforadius tongensis TaxID=1216062 RepID=UPI00195B9022|nr:indolepyruvate oxidoreductase subunit beta [Desulforadius tongensis]MBM7853768.1 indolepyruvate ferredoxin oxidoreductase beta subunit [Desulforadius tongensis]